MKKKLLGYTLNSLLFCAYGVFCWYYSYLKPGYAGLNIFLEALKFIGIFGAAFIGSALAHRLGHIFFALFQGLALLNNSILSRNVRVRLKGAFDTAPALKKNRDKYPRFILGGLIFNIAVILAGAVIYALCLASRTVFSSLVIISLASMISSWYLVYAAFSDDGARRGDFIAYQRARDYESLVMTLAALGAAEKLDDCFLLTEAQNAVAFRIEGGLPLDNEAENALSAIALYAREGKIVLNPLIAAYLGGADA